MPSVASLELRLRRHELPDFQAPQKLGSCGPGKLTEKGRFPKVLRGGCKRSFGPREQRSPKSRAPPRTPFCTGVKWGSGWCKRLFGDLCSLGPKDLLHPPLSTFGNLPFSVNFPGPQLPNPKNTNSCGIAKGSSVSWVAKFKGGKNSECKLSSGWSRSYKVIKLLLSAGKWVVAKLQGDKSAPHSSMELYYP